MYSSTKSHHPLSNDFDGVGFGLLCCKLLEVPGTRDTLPKALKAGVTPSMRDSYAQIFFRVLPSNRAVFLL